MRSLAAILVAGAATACLSVWHVVPLNGVIPVATAATVKVFPASVSCRVLYVIDGDTIRCESPGIEEGDDKRTCKHDGRTVSGCWYIRLIDIDTGETTYEDSAKKTKPKWLCENELKSGLRAKALTELLIRGSGGKVLLKRLAVDRYAGRRDADVLVESNGQLFSLSKILIETKNAVKWSKNVSTDVRKRMFCP